jgi:aminobenzoyl-glutamate utilization protein B
MSAGVNMMREHGYNPDDARIHYVITDGGKQPNVVPYEATVWYYIRARRPEIVSDLLSWTRQIASSSAASTKTQVSERILSGSWPVNGNRALAEIVNRNIVAIGMPKWSTDDQAFARAVQKSMGEKIVGLPSEVEPMRSERQSSSTSDAGDISWNVPYARMFIPAKPDGELAGHHWSAALGPATPIAHKGIAVGSKALIATIIDLMGDPAALTTIKADYARQLAAYPKWASLIPDNAKPPIHLNTEEMAKYRAALAPFEYDPNSKVSYLRFIGAAYPPAEPATAIGKASNAPRPASTKSSLAWDWEKQ